MKRFAAITLALIMALICVPVTAEKADREIEGNLAVFTTAEDFAAGTLENVGYPQGHMDRGFRPRVCGHEKGLDGMAQLGQMERQRKARLRVRGVRFGLYQHR